MSESTVWLVVWMVIGEFVGIGLFLAWAFWDVHCRERDE